MNPGWVGLILLSPGTPTDMPRIGIRAFKAERQLEIWGSKTDRGRYRLLATYPVAAISGDLGPKRAEGDMQVPEGFYFIDWFNPKSRFHLSLGLNYPNSSDRKKRSPGRPLGKDIFIHGNSVSAGCLAMTDPVIDVVYRMATHAKNSGQKAIPATIFPCRMNAANWQTLCAKYANRKDLLQFWSTLMPAYTYFERTHLWPRPHVDKRGNYIWPEIG